MGPNYQRHVRFGLTIEVRRRILPPTSSRPRMARDLHIDSSTGMQSNILPMLRPLGAVTDALLAGCRQSGIPNVFFVRQHCNFYDRRSWPEHVLSVE